MMRQDAGGPSDAATLRQRAEEQLRKDGDHIRPSTDDPQRMIHELRVHQLELEMQNEELRESRDETERLRARYTELYDFAPTGYLTLAPDGTMAESNRAAAALLGRSPAQLTGKRLGVFVADADRTVLNAFLQRLFADGETQHCELTLAGDATTERIVRLEGTRSADGKECRASLTDETARRRAESALRLRDRAMRAVSQGIVITDPTKAGNPIIYVNPGFELMTGYTAAEAAGRNCRFLQGNGTDRAAVARLRTAIDAGEPCAVELVNYKKDGSPFWNALFVTPVRDDQGAIVQFIGVQADVTEQRTLERSLQQAQRMEAVGRLAGGIAQDFNNLLTVINGYSDLLHAEFPAGDPKREMAHEIGQAGERAATLTQQLMAFSRSQVLDPTVLDLNGAVKELGSMIGQLAGDRIEVRTEFDPDAALVRVDAGQIGQVIVNLVVNAREAMPNGGTLTIRTANVTHEQAQRAGHTDLAPGAYVLLSIVDSGTGMSPESAARVFEPFFSTKGVSAGAGRGLGLSMVYGLVKQSDGHIIALSEPGLGTTFSICLPTAAR